MPFFGGSDSEDSGDQFDSRGGRILSKKSKKGTTQKDRTATAGSSQVVRQVPSQVPAPTHLRKEEENDDDFGISQLNAAAAEAETSHLISNAGRWGGGNNKQRIGGTNPTTSGTTVSGASSRPTGGLFAKMKGEAEKRKELHTLQIVQQHRREREAEGEDQNLQTKDLEQGTFQTSGYKRKLARLEAKHGKKALSSTAAMAASLTTEEEEEDDYYNQLNNFGATVSSANPSGGQGSVGFTAKKDAVALLEDLVGVEDGEDSVGQKQQEGVEEGKEVVEQDLQENATGTVEGNEIREQEGKVEDEDAPAASPSAREQMNLLEQKEKELMAFKQEQRRAKTLKKLPDSYLAAQKRHLVKVRQEREAQMVSYARSL